MYKAHAKYNVNHRYILSVIDVFSKFIHMVPVKTKTGPSVAFAFRSIFADPKYTSRHPVWVRTDKGKVFIHKHFQDMLLDESSIQFHVCTNTYLKMRSWNVCIPRFAIYSTNILHIKIPTDISIIRPNLSRPTMTRFTRRQEWRPRESPIRTC